jgi:hypothetical protein
MRRLLLACGTVVLLAGCSFGPATRDELCAGFDELGDQALSGNAGLGNPLFREAGQLADLAERYDGRLYGDADALRAIADSYATDLDQLRNASMHIADECGSSPVGFPF